MNELFDIFKLKKRQRGEKKLSINLKYFKARDRQQLQQQQLRDKLKMKRLN